MDPHEDFQTWCLILTTSFESNDYSILPTVTSLINEVITHSKLQGNLEEYTDYFIKSILPEALLSILDISYYASQAPIFINFLSSAAQLIPWSAVNDNFDYARKLLQILSEEQNIYTYNRPSYYQTYKILETVSLNYQNGPNSKLLFDFIIQNSIPLTTNNNANQEIDLNSSKLKIEHFEILFQSYYLIDNNQLSDIQSRENFFQIVPHFITFLSYFNTNDRLRKLDSSSLNIAFQSIISIMLDHPKYPATMKLFPRLFEIADNLVQSEMIQKQLIGAAVLNKSAMRDHNLIDNAFKQWAKTTKLPQFLVEKSLHPKLLEELEIVIAKIISPQHLESFWEKAEKANSSEQSTLLLIISKALENFDINLTKSFIERIKSKQFISPELLKFLADVARTFAAKSRRTHENSEDYLELSMYIIDILIEYGEKADNSDDAVDALAIFAPYSENSACKEKIEKDLSQRLTSNPTKQPFYIKVLYQMVDQTYPTVQGYSKNFLWLIINTISCQQTDEIGTRSDLYALLSLLIIKKRYQLNLQMIQKLAEFRIDDFFWKFLTDIIKGLGIDAYDDYVSDELYSIIKKIDFVNDSTDLFISFVENYILISNLRIRNLKNENYQRVNYDYYERKIPHAFYLSNFPSRINVLFKIIMLAKDSDVANQAAFILLALIEKSKKKKMQSIMSMFIKQFNKAPTVFQQNAIKKHKNSNQDSTADNTSNQRNESSNNSSIINENQNDDSTAEEEGQNENQAATINDKSQIDDSSKTNETVSPKTNENDLINKIEFKGGVYLAKCRILKTILQYLDISEIDAYLDDYGVARHKEKTNVLKRLTGPDSLTLNVVYDQSRFQIQTNKNVTTKSLQKRICRKLQISGLDIYYNNSTLLHYQTLALSHIQNNSTIICKDTNFHGQYIASEDTSSIIMPTMILYENDFSKSMLEILMKESENEENKLSLENLQKMAFQMLKRLPSDINIVNEVNTMQIFISNLEKSVNNPRLFLYRLRILLTSFKEKQGISAQFMELGGTKLLTDFLLEHEPPFHGINLVLDTLNHLFLQKSPVAFFSETSPSQSYHEQQIIEYLMQLFDLADMQKNVKKSLQPALEFINCFLTVNPIKTSEIIFQHLDLLEKMINNIDINSKEQKHLFYSFVSLLRDRVQLFHLAVRMIDKRLSSESTSKEIGPNLIYIIQMTIGDVHNQDDIKIVLDSCWKVILNNQEICLNNSGIKSPIPENIPIDNHAGVPLNGNQSGQFSPICKIIRSIIIQEDELKQYEIEHTDHLNQLLRLALLTEDRGIQENMFQLCSLLLPEPTDFKHFSIIINTLRDAINQVQTDRWNYQPATFSKSPTGYTGLKNLGSTCYMNSIFQQLFFTFPFRYLICLCDMTPKSKNESDGYQQLKELFAQLLLTKRNFCDTQPFCSTWKGWDKRIINPREQQDAFEFLQILLDQLPSQFHFPFKGEIQNTIEGLTEDFKSFNNEEFYTICLDIKGFQDVESSLKSFIQSEMFTGDNQYSVSKDHKIDAKKYAKIKTAPDILVLQLKRFEYNLTNFQKIKVNDRYEFSNTINISPFMIDDQSANSDRFNYELTGVVVHSGNAQGGHYYSIIRIDGHWIKFNDIEVVEITQSDFEKETFGGQNEVDFEDSAGASAYLLFYRRINAFYEVDLPKSLYLCHSTQQQSTTEIENELNENEKLTQENEFKESDLSKENKSIEINSKETPTENVGEKKQIETKDTEQTNESELKENNQSTDIIENEKEAKDEDKPNENESKENINNDKENGYENESHKSDENETNKNADTEQAKESELKENNQSTDIIENEKETKDEDKPKENESKENVNNDKENGYENESHKSDENETNKNADNDKSDENKNNEEMVHVTLRYDQPFDITYLLDPTIVNSIEKDNTNFSSIQAIFSDSTFNFITNLAHINDIECLISYFFKIFCHSSLSHFVKNIMDKIYANLNSMENYEYCFNFIETNFVKTIEPIYLYCYQNELISAATHLLETILKRVSIERAFQFVDKFFSLLVYALNLSWRQIPYISELILFILSLPDSYEIAERMNWSNKLIDFVILVYDPNQPNCLIQSDDSFIGLSQQSSSSSSCSTTSATNAHNRSNVIIQNISLGNIINAIALLFCHSKRKDCEKILKYNNSILQSPLNSQSYFYLLKQMFSYKLIDLNYLITILTSPKRESNEEMLYEIVMQKLISLDDNDEIEEILNQINSLSESFTNNLIKSIKARHQQVINFLLKYPRQTLIKFMTSSDQATRQNTEKIIYKIFNKVSKLPTNNNAVFYDDSSSDDYQFSLNTRSDLLNDQDKQLMSALYTEFISFIFDMDEESMSDYYNPNGIHGPDDFYLITFLRIFRWMILRLDKFDDESFNAVQMLFNNCAEADKEFDYTMAECLRIISEFQIATQRNVFHDNYNAIMKHYTNVKKLKLSERFKLFAPYLNQSSTPDDLRIILIHPSCPYLIDQITKPKTNSKSVELDLFGTLIRKYIDDDTQFTNDIGIDDQLGLNGLTLKHLIYYRLKRCFSPDVIRSSKIYHESFLKLITICYKYFNPFTRLVLLEELISHLKYNINNCYYSPIDDYFMQSAHLVNLVISDDKSKLYEQVELPVQLKQDNNIDPFDFITPIEAVKLYQERTAPNKSNCDDSDEEDYVQESHSNELFNITTIPNISSFLNCGISDPDQKMNVELIISNAYLRTALFESIYYSQKDDILVIRNIVNSVAIQEAQNRLTSIISLLETAQKSGEYSQQNLKDFQPLFNSKLLATTNYNEIKNMISPHQFNQNYTNHLTVFIEMVLIITKYEVTAKRICDKMNFRYHFPMDQHPSIGDFYASRIKYIYRYIEQLDDRYNSLFYDQMNYHFENGLTNNPKNPVNIDDVHTYINYVSNYDNEWVISYVKLSIGQYKPSVRSNQFYKTVLESQPDDVVIQIFQELCDSESLPPFSPLQIFLEAKPNLKSQFLCIWPIKNEQNSHEQDSTSDDDDYSDDAKIKIFFSPAPPKLTDSSSSDEEE